MLKNDLDSYLSLREFSLLEKFSPMLLSNGIEDYLKLKADEGSIKDGKVAADFMVDFFNLPLKSQERTLYAFKTFIINLQKEADTGNVTVTTHLTSILKDVKVKDVKDAQSAEKLMLKLMLKCSHMGTLVKTLDSSPSPEKFNALEKFLYALGKLHGSSMEYEKFSILGSLEKMEKEQVLALFDMEFKRSHNPLLIAIESGNTDLVKKMLNLISEEKRGEIVSKFFINHYSLLDYLINSQYFGLIEVLLSYLTVEQKLKILKTQPPGYLSLLHMLVEERKLENLKKFLEVLTPEVLNGFFKDLTPEGLKKFLKGLTPEAIEVPTPEVLNEFCKGLTPEGLKKFLESLITEAIEAEARKEAEAIAAEARKELIAAQTAQELKILEIQTKFREMVHLGIEAGEELGVIEKSFKDLNLTVAQIFEFLKTQPPGDLPLLHVLIREGNSENLKKFLESLITEARAAEAREELIIAQKFELLKIQAVKHYGNYTALHLAVDEVRKQEVLKGILEEFFKDLTTAQKFELLKMRTKFGETVLHLAIVKGVKLEVIEVLLQGLTVAQKFELLEGQPVHTYTVLHLAILKKVAPEVEKALLKDLTPEQVQLLLEKAELSGDADFSTAALDGIENVVETRVAYTKVAEGAFLTL